jgi:TrmH family RNA methyltransferase
MLSKNEVKHIRSLFLKKGRLLSGCFPAEGTRLVNHLLMYHSDLLQKLYVTSSYSMPDNLVISPDRITEIGEKELESISGLQQPQDVLAIFKQATTKDFGAEEEGWYFALDGIRDPGNLGTIFRLADWFGIKGIICSEDCVDQYNPKVVQASMGSILTVPVQITSLPVFLQKTRLPITGAVLDGHKPEKQNLTSKGIMVIGNEAEGIRANVLPYLQHKVTIPSYGTAESLNAALAAGILMWELKR